MIYTKQSTINANGPAIAAYIRAIAQAETFIQGHPAEAKVLLNDYLNLGQTVTDAMYAVAAPDFAKSPQISQGEYNVAAQFHLKAGLIKAIPPYNQFVAVNTINCALGTGCQS